MAAGGDRVMLLLLAALPAVVSPAGLTPCKLSPKSAQMRAWSELKARGPQLEAVIHSTDYRRVVPVKRVWELWNESVLEELAGPTGLLAVAFQMGAHTPDQYGHVWTFMHSVHQALLMRRAPGGAQGNWTRTLAVFLPSGGPAGSEGIWFREFEAIFGGPRGRDLFGVEVKRAPWVPFCWAQCCVHFGDVPADLRGKVNLLTQFQLTEWVSQASLGAFREHALLALGLGPPSAPSTPDTFLYVRTRRWTSHRRVQGEEALVELLRAFAAARRPGLRFVAEDVHELSFADEARLFARSAVVVSSFGSSLHNCRFMRPMATVLELHGALHQAFNDFWAYHFACALPYGLLHAPFPVWGSIPVCESARHRASRCYSAPDHGFSLGQSEYTARINHTQLLDWLQQVLPADAGDSERARNGCAPPVPWLSVFAGYESMMVWPFTGLPKDKARHYATGPVRRRKPLPPQYNSSCAPRWGMDVVPVRQ